MWIDTHCHLDFPWKGQTPSDVEMEGMIERARAKGVKHMINVGCDLPTFLAGLKLATAHPFIFCTLGVHPNEAEQWNSEVDARFRAFLEEDRQRSSKQIVAIGEIGLDTFREGAPFEVQVAALRGQLVLARDFDLPVMIHCRDAFLETLRVLEEEKVPRVVFHCYSGDLALAKEVWAKGWFTSFTAVVSYPKNEALREVVRQAPANQYFIETDAPFLPHQEIRGKRNEPAELVRCGETVAAVRQQSLEQVASESTNNALRFFELGDP